MALQPNLVLGAAGAVIAIVTAGYIGANWDSLTGVHTYEAVFSATHESLVPRDGSVPGNGRKDEAVPFPHDNVSRIDVYLTWTDPVVSPPEIQVQVKDPKNVVRGSARHQGGISGIRFEVVLIPATEVPTGRHTFEARSHDEALATLYESWPNHPEGRGTWTFTISSTSSGAPGSTPYTLRVGYDHYQASLERFVTPGK